MAQDLRGSSIWNELSRASFSPGSTGTWAATVGKRTVAITRQRISKMRFIGVTTKWGPFKGALHYNNGA